MELAQLLFSFSFSFRNSDSGINCITMMLQFISYFLLRFSFITSHDFMRDTHVQSSRIEIRMKRFNFEIVEIDMLVFYQTCEELLINFNLLNGSLYNNIDITDTLIIRIR